MRQSQSDVVYKNPFAGCPAGKHRVLSVWFREIPVGSLHLDSTGWRFYYLKYQPGGTESRVSDVFDSLAEAKNWIETEFLIRRENQLFLESEND